MKKPRLLFICQDLQYYRMHWEYRISKAASSGYDVIVAAPDIPDRGDPHLQWVSFPLIRRGKNVLSEIRTLIAICKLVRTLHPDLIHATSAKLNVYTGIAARRVHSVPVVMSVTGLGYLFTHNHVSVRLIRQFLLCLYRYGGNNRKARIVFENKDDCALFLSKNIGDENRCVCLPGAGVDLDVFSPTPEPTGVPVVMLVARMLWDKGVGEFVEAARQLTDAGVLARFVLVGDNDGDNLDSIPSERLKAWHGSGIVEWWGYQRSMPSVLAQSNLVCLPSYYREGIPMSLIEAAACGRAIVATDAPGCREIVRDGDNGLLIPVRDARQLANALKTLLKDPAMRFHMGKRGRQIAEAEYGQERVVSKTLAVYREAMA